MRWWSVAATLGLVLVGCGGSDDKDPVKDEAAGSGGSGATGGSGGGGGSTTTTDAKAVVSCADRQLVVNAPYVHDFATDASNYYWLAFSNYNIAVFKQAKSGGSPTIVTEFPGYFSYIAGDTTLAVSGDSQFYMDDTVADDLDDYVYFSGDKQIWRVKKDGSAAVEPVSGVALNELGPATCNFARSVLAPDALYACRQGRLFRMARAGDATAKAVYSAPDGTSIDAFAVSDSQLFVNGPYDETRHFAPILALPLAGGTPTEYGAMLEGLVPDALVTMGDGVVFDSLFFPTGDDLETTSEWAKRQGTYKLTGSTATPQKLSEDNLELVRGVGKDSKYVYAVIGDQKIVRISLDGTTTTFVDCHDSPDDVRFNEFLVDEDGVYVRWEDSFYRFNP